MKQLEKIKGDQKISLIKCSENEFKVEIFNTKTLKLTSIIEIKKFEDAIDIYESMGVKK